MSKTEDLWSSIASIQDTTWNQISFQDLGFRQMHRPASCNWGSPGLQVLQQKTKVSPLSGRCRLRWFTPDSRSSSHPLCNRLHAFLRSNLSFMANLAVDNPSTTFGLSRPFTYQTSSNRRGSVGFWGSRVRLGNSLMRTRIPYAWSNCGPELIPYVIIG